MTGWGGGGGHNAKGERFEALFAQARVHYDSKPRLPDFNFTSWMLAFSMQNTNMMLEAWAVSCANVIATSRGGP